ncbi:TfoX/Sxy family protein [Achromobacter sp. GG226]|uniref:TfoX/Sxy family protein n=1 Tax=Verticiella alkaliphila TaxID=2779529 RepID=UPI001C0C91D4|nr:TfoX/Sxy family protein [Verticiella sp. GG226]MBU4609433.1 TfoX/Sxy family protein [Verticiella sp. GG226]
MPAEHDPALLDAIRHALEDAGELDEKVMFGCHVFMLDGKLCAGVRGDELLVRLPPDLHDDVAERPGVRPLAAQGGMQGYFFVDPSGYATAAQWQFWIGTAKAFNPQARRSPSKRRTAAKRG